MQQKLKKGIEFNWSIECQKVFESIKEYLISKPILCIYNKNKECYLFTDASKVGIGAVLKQLQEDNLLHPIGYFSRKLKPYQVNYDVTNLECLAVIDALEFWHHYLYGKKFMIYTDHHALRWLKSIKNPNSRLFNWSLKLSQYHYQEIKYIPGKQNLEADCLSRNPIDILDDNTNEEHIRIVNLIDKTEIIEKQMPFKSNLPKNCQIENDFIVNNQKQLHKIYVPDNLIPKLIKRFHIEFGHIGLKQMLLLLSSTYYFTQMSERISQFVKSCEVCQKNKINRELKLGQLSHLGPAKWPYEIVSMDTVGGFGGFNSAKQYIHLAIDHFSRYLWTVCSKKQSAKDFINLIKQVSQTKKPSLILADQYTGIKSNELSNYLSKNNIKLIFTAVNSPASNGMVERVNQTVVTRLRCMINDGNERKCWPKLLDICVEQYNKTPHTVTQFSPEFLLTGVRPFESYAQNITIDQAHKIAFENSQKNHEINKQLYDSKHKRIVLNPNDLVLVENKNEISRKKLEPIMLGPFKVVNKLSNTMYEVQCDKKGKITDKFHISKLRIYNIPQ